MEHDLRQMQGSLRNLIHNLERLFVGDSHGNLNVGTPQRVFVNNGHESSDNVAHYILPDRVPTSGSVDSTVTEAPPSYSETSAALDSFSTMISEIMTGHAPSSGQTPVPPTASNSYRDGPLRYTFHDVKPFMGDEPRNFKFTQLSREGAVPIKGQVIIRGALSRPPAIAVDLDIKLSHDDLGDALEILHSEDSGLLEIRTNNKSAKSVTPGSYIQITATISVSLSVMLDEFFVKTAGMNILIDDTDWLSTGYLKLHTISGNIESRGKGIVPPKGIMAPRISIETTSGKVSGGFPLPKDHIRIKSDSGAVSLFLAKCLTPIHDDDDCCEINVRTVSGDVSLNCDKIHESNDNTLTIIQTASGSIMGRYSLSMHASFKTTSGRIGMGLLCPEKNKTDGELDHDFEFESASGAISAHLEGISGKLGIFKGKMTSVSASVQADLPASWTGSVDACAVTGTVKVGDGEGVRIWSKSDGFHGVGKKIHASRGISGGKLTASTTSGAVNVSFK